MRINGIVSDKFSLSVEADNLAACPEARVYCKDVFPSEGRREEELPQVFGEYPYGFFIRPLFGGKACLGFDRQ